jgi:hypothetical protein
MPRRNGASSAIRRPADGSTPQRYSLVGGLAASGSRKCKAITIPPRLKASINVRTFAICHRGLLYPPPSCAGRLSARATRSRLRGEVAEGEWTVIGPSIEVRAYGQAPGRWRYAGNFEG